MTNSILSASKKLLKGLAVLAFWVGVWYALALVINQELLIPTPHKTLLVLFEFAKTGKFWLSVLFSTLRILSGFLIGVFIGALGGILSV